MGSMPEECCDSKDGDTRGIDADMFFNCLSITIRTAGFMQESKAKVRRLEDEAQAWELENLASSDESDESMRVRAVGLRLCAREQ